MLTMEVLLVMASATSGLRIRVGGTGDVVAYGRLVHDDLTRYARFAERTFNVEVPEIPAARVRSRERARR